MASTTMMRPAFDLRVVTGASVPAGFFSVVYFMMLLLFNKNVSVLRAVSRRRSIRSVIPRLLQHARVSEHRNVAVLKRITHRALKVGNRLVEIRLRLHLLTARGNQISLTLQHQE